MEHTFVKRGLPTEDEIRNHAGVWLLDFDHTILAANSTELFLSRARPAFVMLPLLLIIRKLIPWQHVPNTYWWRLRDAFCVVLIAFLTPWNLWLWARSARSLFVDNCCKSLETTFLSVQPQRCVIISFGFDFLLRWLVKGSRWEHCHRICPPLFSCGRSVGIQKSEMARNFLDEATLAGAAFITDSLADRDLLEKVELPILIQPAGTINDIFAGTYAPLHYTITAKYDRIYFIGNIVSVELVLALLSVVSCVVADLASFPALLLLWFSMMVIYEIGYFENDHFAAKSEQTPVVSFKAGSFAHTSFEGFAWVWATLLAACGLFLLPETDSLRFRPPPPAVHSYMMIGSWILVLSMIRLGFYFYNHRPPERRILLYPFLQTMKLMALFSVVVPSVIGALAITSQIIMMWINYLIYRSGGDKSTFPREAVRLLVFVILLVAWCLSLPSYPTPSSLLQGAPVTVWVFYRFFSDRIAAKQRRKIKQGSLSLSTGPHG